MDEKSTLRISAELDKLSTVRRFIKEKAAGLAVDPEVIDDVLLATDEAVTNVIVHGYKGCSGNVEIEVGCSGESLVIRVRDHAPPFDPTCVPSPDLNLPLEQRPYGGMGVYIIRKLMDHVSHRVMPQGGNELIMVKKALL
jgi:serine/threonine-protein kinase RsbW